jgi:hypothetical protein
MDAGAEYLTDAAQRYTADIYQGDGDGVRTLFGLWR